MTGSASIAKCYHHMPRHLQVSAKNLNIVALGLSTTAWLKKYWVSLREGWCLLDWSIHLLQCLFVLGLLWHLGNGGFLYREREGTDLFWGNVRHLLTTNWCLEGSQMSGGNERGFGASPGCPCLCGWAKNSSSSLHSPPSQLLPAHRGPLYSLMHFFSNTETFCKVTSDTWTAFSNAPWSCSGLMWTVVMVRAPMWVGQ